MTAKQNTLQASRVFSGGDGLGRDLLKPLPLITFIVLALIIISGPYFRGLYFSDEMLAIHVIGFTFASLWLLAGLREPAFYIIRPGPMEWAFFLMVFCYLLSLFFAVNIRDAVNEFFNTAVYLVFYLLTLTTCRVFKMPLLTPANKRASQGGRNRCNRMVAQPAGIVSTEQVFLQLLFFSGLLLALISLLALGGQIDFVGSYVWGRLFSPLQYANAAASYFFASLILGLGLFSSSDHPKLKLLYIAASLILFIALILTYSRLVWLLLGPLLILFVLLAQRNKRSSLGLAIFSIVVIGLPVALAAYELFIRGFVLPAWSLILGAMLLSPGAVICAEKFLPALKRGRGEKLVAVVIILLLVLGAGAALTLLGRPLSLQNTISGGEALYHEQQVNAVGEGSYSLTLSAATINEDKLPGAGAYNWKMVVLALVADPFSNEYFEQKILVSAEQAKAIMQQHEYAFRTPAATRKLIIRLYGSSAEDAASVLFRDVTLHGPAGSRTLSFNLHRILPAELYKRVTLFRPQIGEEPRIAHYRDAIKIISDHPLGGAGGGAWAALYPAYMTREYVTTEPHSHPLKIWIEAGLFAFLAYLAIWVFYAHAYFKARSSKTLSPAAAVQAAAVFVAVLALVIHGAVDFLLSLGALSLYLFILTATGRSLFPDLDAGRADSVSVRGLKHRRVSRIILFALVISSVALIINLSLLFGSWSGRAALWELEQNNQVEAEALLRRAIFFDPLEAENYYLLALLAQARAERLSLENGAGINKANEEARQMAEQAHRLAPYNTVYNRHYALLLLAFGDLTPGLALLEENMRINPFHPDHYRQFAAASLAAAQYLLAHGEEEAGLALIEQLASVEEMMGQYHHDTSGLNFYLGWAHYLRGNIADAKEALSAVKEDDQAYDMALELLRRINREQD